MNLELWKQRKKELRLTFEDLHAKTGVSVRRLKSLFNGEKQNTTISTAQAIEKALGITEETINLSENEIKLINTLRKLPQSKQDLAISTFCNSLELLNND